MPSRADMMGFAMRPEWRQMRCSRTVVGSSRVVATIGGRLARVMAGVYEFGGLWGLFLKEDAKMASFSRRGLVNGRCAEDV